MGAIAQSGPVHYKIPILRTKTVQSGSCMQEFIRVNRMHQQFKLPSAASFVFPYCKRRKNLSNLEDGNRKFAAVMLNKVPEITLAFWIIKILSTTVGET